MRLQLNQPLSTFLLVLSILAIVLGIALFEYGHAWLFHRLASAFRQCGCRGRRRGRGRRAASEGETPVVIAKGIRCQQIRRGRRSSRASWITTPSAVTVTARSGVSPSPTARSSAASANRTADGSVGLELRVEHNGQVFRTEVHTERVAFYRRVEELRAMLEAEGWTLTR